MTDDEKKFKQNQEAHKEKIKAQKDEERAKKLAQQTTTQNQMGSSIKK